MPFKRSIDGEIYRVNDILGCLMYNCFCYGVCDEIIICASACRVALKALSIHTNLIAFSRHDALGIECNLYDNGLTLNRDVIYEFKIHFYFVHC